MKKLVFIIITIFVTLLLSGCGTKKALTKSEFDEILGMEGFVVLDVTNMMEDESIEVLSVANSDKYQFEYHIYKTVDGAKAAYEGNKKAFEGYKKNNSKEISKSINNYDKYSLELSDEYKVISRIDNTLIYASINLEYKKDFNIILDKLGY